MRTSALLLGIGLLLGCNSPAPAGSDSGPPALTCSTWCVDAISGTCAGVTDMAACVAGCGATAAACTSEHAAYFACIGSTTPVCGRCTAEYTAVGTCFSTYCAANPTATGCT